MTEPKLRIISLLPSATEIVSALGLSTHIVGRSHECDWPCEVRSLPVCTRPRIALNVTSAEIDRQVSDYAAHALSIYELDFDVLRAARPTHIITQDQCEVCAVSLKDVEAAIASDIGQDSIARDHLFAYAYLGFGEMEAEHYQPMTLKAFYL